jgi:prepilin-type N-terminal cleavage/methylation domain-containing protein
MKNNTPVIPVPVKRNGFTLVELAIVLMIIGLLIGGILKGQELINNARVQTVMRNVKGYEAAITTFRDSYAAWPGDIASPSTRLPNCTAAPCNIAGNGDSILDVVCADVNCQVNPFETRRFWVHLQSANLISGVDTSYTGTPDTWGTDFPKSPLGGGFVVQQFASPASGSAAGFYGTGLMLKDIVNSMYNPGLTPGQAGQIDRKMDDGKPFSGDIVNPSGNATCYSGTEYNESVTTKSCALVFKIQS